MKKAGKWIMMSSAILLNAFIIFHSCLPSAASSAWSEFFSRIFENIINSASKGQPADKVPVSSIKLNYTISPLNTVDGYTESDELHELPIGCAKLLSASIYPANATNKAVSYTVEGDSINVVQSGTSFSVIGKQTGTSTITVRSKEKSEIMDSYSFTVVDLKAPKTFELTCESIDIALGGADVAPVQIKNDSITSKINDKAVFLQRYYDSGLLNVVSDDNSIVEVRNVLGVKNLLVGKALGTTNITISNNIGVSKTLTVNVNPASTNNNYEDLDDLVTYTDELDVARDSLETGYKFNYSNTIFCPIDPLSVKTTSDGYVYGYRKFTNDDNYATVRLIDKNDVTNYKDYSFRITDRIPTSFNVRFSGSSLNAGIYSVSQGKAFSISISSNPINAYYASYTVTASDPDFVKINASGSNFVIETQQYGDFVLHVVCNQNPEVKAEYRISVIKRGIINPDNEDDFFSFMRKSLGHFTLFFLDGIFTTLAIFFMWPKLKKWALLLITLGVGAVMALGTELIQYLTSSWSGRAGSIVDSGIDFAGYLSTVLIVFLIIILVEKNKKNKSKFY